MEQIVLQTKENIFLRFYLEEIPEKKKTAVGVRGIQLKERDFIIEVYLMEVEQKEIFVKEKAVLIDRIKLTQKDTKGMRLRI